MAQLAKLQFTVQDNQGVPLSGISVSVRNQGATVSAATPPTYTVDDPGSITTSSTIQNGATGTTIRNVTTVTATSIVASGPGGIGSMSDDDRIVVTTPLPTLYNDPVGNETKSNPLTTDANGAAYCWIEGGAYDIIYSGTGYTTRLEMDRMAVGERRQSTVLDGATAVAFRLGTQRTLTNTAAKILTLDNPIGTAKVSFYEDGDVDLVNLTTSGTVTITLGATMLSTASVAGLLTASAGFTLSGGTLTLPAGSVETADLAANAVVVTRTAVGTADQNIAAAAYAVGTYTDITDATLTFTPAASTSEIVVVATCPYEVNAAGNVIMYAAILDSAGAILHEAAEINTGGVVGNPGSLGLTWRGTGLTGSQTFKVAMQCVTTNARVNNATNAAAIRITRITAMEFKK